MPRNKEGVVRVEELVEVEVVQVEVEVAEVEVAEGNHQPPHVSFFATTTACGEQHPLHMRPPSFPSRVYLLLHRASLFFTANFSGIASSLRAVHPQRRFSLPRVISSLLEQIKNGLTTSTCSRPCSSQTLSPAAIGTGWHLGGLLRQHWQHGSHSNSGDPDRSNEPNSCKVVRKGSLRLHSLIGRREEENPVEARRHRPVHVAS